MHPPDSTIYIPVMGGSIIGLLGVAIKLWSDVQGLKEKSSGWEEACKKVAAHETEIALLKAAVTDLRAVPAKIDELRELMLRGSGSVR